MPKGEMSLYEEFHDRLLVKSHNSQDKHKVLYFESR